MDKKLTVVINEVNGRSIDKVVSEIKKSKLYKNDEIEVFIIAKENKYNEFNYIESGDSVAQKYNEAIEKSTGEYIQFMDSVSQVRGEDYDFAIEYVIKKGLEIVCFTTKSFGSKSKWFVRNRVFKKEDMLLKFNSHFSSYIFKNIDMVFNEKYYEDATNELLLKKLNKEEKLIVLKKLYLYENIDDDLYRKTFYLDSIDELVTNLPNIEMNDFLQKRVLNLLSLKFIKNMNAENKGVLNKEEAKQFFDKVKIVLNNISDKNILAMKESTEYEILKQIFLSIKYDDLKLDLKDIPVLLNNNNEIVDTLENKSVDIVSMDYVFGKLNIDCELIYKSFMKKGAKILVYVDGHKIDVKENGVYSVTKIFNIPMHNRYTFHFSIDGKYLKNNSKISIMSNV